MPNIIKPVNKKLDQQLSREIPSQIPVNATKESYDRMISHCMSEKPSGAGFWACRKSGARIKAKMVLMNIWDEKTMQMTHKGVPIVTLFCSGCDQPPKIAKNTGLWKSEIITLSM